METGRGIERHAQVRDKMREVRTLLLKLRDLSRQENAELAEFISAKELNNVS